MNSAKEQRDTEPEISTTFADVVYQKMRIITATRDLLSNMDNSVSNSLVYEFASRETRARTISSMSVAFCGNQGDMQSVRPGEKRIEKMNSSR